MTDSGSVMIDAFMATVYAMVYGIAHLFQWIFRITVFVLTVTTIVLLVSVAWHQIRKAERKE